jgi:hypothetical protein
LAWPGVGEAEVLELEAEILGDRLAAGEHGEILLEYRRKSVVLEGDHGATPADELELGEPKPRSPGAWRRY